MDDVMDRIEQITDYHPNVPSSADKKFGNIKKKDPESHRIQQLTCQSLRKRKALRKKRHNESIAMFQNRNRNQGHSTTAVTHSEMTNHHSAPGRLSSSSSSDETDLSNSMELIHQYNIIINQSNQARIIFSMDYRAMQRDIDVDERNNSAIARNNRPINRIVREITTREYCEIMKTYQDIMEDAIQQRDLLMQENMIQHTKKLAPSERIMMEENETKTKQHSTTSTELIDTTKETTIEPLDFEESNTNDDHDIMHPPKTLEWGETTYLLSSDSMSFKW
jgi:hypothetical protein